MYTKFGSRRLTQVALAMGMAVAASAGAFAQLTLQGSVPVGDPNDPNNMPGAPRNEPRDLAISTFGGLPRAWVADYGHGGVDVLDLSVVPTVHAAFLPSPANYPHAVAVDVNGSTAAITYYSPLNGTHVSLYNVSTLAPLPLAGFDVGPARSGSELAGIAIVDNTILVVTDRTRNLIQTWGYAGPQAGNLIDSVSTINNTRANDPNGLGPGFGPTDVKIVTRGANRFAAIILSDSDRLEAYTVRANGDLSNNPVTIRPVGSRPTSLAVEVTRRTLYITNSGDDSVRVIGQITGDPNGVLLTNSINGPSCITLSTDVSGNAHVYVSNRNSRQISYFAGPLATVPAFVGILNISRAPYSIASQFGLPVGLPPNPPSIGDRIVVTSLADDAADDIGR